MAPKGGRPRRNRQGKSAVHARPKEGDKGITAESRGSKRPKARLDFLLNTMGRPRPPLKSSHGDTLSSCVAIVSPIRSQKESPWARPPTITAPNRAWGEANVGPTKGVQPPSGRSAGHVHHRPGRPATGGTQPPHGPHIKAKRPRRPRRTVSARLGGGAARPSG